jgi:GTP-binding protein
LIVLRADFVKSAPDEKSWPAPGAPEVAFCGRSNVGKSSCLNALAQRHDLARVSKTPGRTRLINFFELDVAEETRSGGRHAPKTIRLVDLPGYGFAAGPREERMKWKKMIESYLLKRAELRAFVVLVDGELGPQPNDGEMLEWLASLKRKPIIVATKIDKLSKTRRAQALQKHARTLGLEEGAVLPFSSKERIGVDELWLALLREAGLS